MEPAPPSFVGPYDPSVDDVRILLFARCDREKEDWYRRFQAASNQNHIDNAASISPADSAIPHEHETQFGDMVFVNDEDVLSSTTTNTPTIGSINVTNTDVIVPKTTVTTTTAAKDDKDVSQDVHQQPNEQQSIKISPTTDGLEKKNSRSNSLMDGLIMTPCAHRGPSEYVRFMSRYQVSVMWAFYLLMFLFLFFIRF